MPDIYSQLKRSKIMSKISASDTKQEILVRKYIFSKGFRFRINDKRYPGKPDIVIPKHKTVIFIHGCFWHGHSCKKGKLPETNRRFWTNKIGNTKKRDKKNKAVLESMGWKVITIWQCELNTKSNFEKRMNILIANLK